MKRCLSILILLISLFLLSCGKRELTRDKAKQLILASPDFSNAISKPMLTKEGFEKGRKEGMWRQGIFSYDQSITKDGSQFFSSIEITHVVLREPAQTKDIEITGITDYIGPLSSSSSAGAKEAQFKWSYDSLPGVVKRYVVSGGTGAALFRLYDDGWRLEDLEISFSSEPAQLSEAEKAQEQAAQKIIEDQKRHEAEQAKQAAELRARREKESRTPTKTIAEYENLADDRSTLRQQWVNGKVKLTDVDISFSQSGEPLNILFGIITNLQPSDTYGNPLLFINFKRGTYKTSTGLYRDGARVIFRDAATRDRLYSALSTALADWQKKYSDLR